MMAWSNSRSTFSRPAVCCPPPQGLEAEGDGVGECGGVAVRHEDAVHAVVYDLTGAADAYATTGIPVAMPSIKVTPNPSRVEGRT